VFVINFEGAFPSCIQVSFGSFILPIAKSDSYQACLNNPALTVQL
jgi:hypothetical protein